MIALKCCVIIPTYNNDRTLDKIIRGVLEYTDQIIIVNDGCTDSTPLILQNYSFLQILTIHRNTGKGHALRVAFDHALSLGYYYAITIDSDGQHFPEDIPLFIERIEKEPDSIILGARNMAQVGVPGTSNFGHNFSIFWFKVETGLNIPDVQTGYRLYPLNRIHEIKQFFTVKFEFEVEVLVRLAWKGVRVLSVPIRIYYAPKEERVTHFRKVRDFSRVSIVNTIMVFMALLWIRPLIFVRNFKRRSFKEFIRENITNSKDSNSKIALSVAVGAFMGVMPIWGWQMLAAVAVASFFRLNRFIALASSNISIPPLLPFILFLSYFSGELVLGGSSDIQPYTTNISLAWVKQNLLQYLVGSLVFGFLLAITMGSLTYLLLQILRRQKPQKIN